MKTLGLLEWMKIRKYRTFWVLLTLFTVASAAINYVFYSFESTVSVQTGGHLRLQLFRTPDLWNTTGWLEGFCLVITGFLFIVLCTNEYSFRTQRQHVIEGLSRTQFILSKWLLLAGIAVFSWLVYFIITLLIGLSVNTPVDLFDGFQSAGYFFLKTVLALGVAFMFSIGIRRPGLAIALYLVYYLLLEGIIGHFLNNAVAHLGDFLPLASGAALITSPFSLFLHQSGGSRPDACWFLCAGIGWMILFVVLSLWYIRRADL